MIWKSKIILCENINSSKCERKRNSEIMWKEATCENENSNNENNEND